MENKTRFELAYRAVLEAVNLALFTACQKRDSISNFLFFYVKGFDKLNLFEFANLNFQKIQQISLIRRYMRKTQNPLTDVAFLGIYVYLITAQSAVHALGNSKKLKFIV